MSAPTGNSAASFIDQIKAEYREVANAESTALPHAIQCGELLTKAKENLKAERGGKWLDWLKTNCPEIAQETASLYMRLAEHRAKVGKAKSIRDARELLPKRKRSGSPPAPSVKLKALVADQLLTKLVEANWEDDQLSKLATLISDRLEKKKRAVAPAGISNAVTNSPSPQTRTGAQP